MELNVSQARFYRAGVDSPTAKASPPDLLSSEGNAELYGPSSKSFSTEIPQNFSFQSPKALVDAYQFWIFLLNFAMKIPDLLEVRNTETSLGDSALSRELQTFFFFLFTLDAIHLWPCMVLAPAENAGSCSHPGLCN